MSSKLKNILIPCILLFSLLFIGCSGKKTEPVTMDSILAGLTSDGYKAVVQELPDESYDFFPMSTSVTFYIKDSNDVGLTIYTFKSAEIAQQQAKTISKDGSRIGDHFIDWYTQSFFLKDNLIIHCDSRRPYVMQLKKVGTSITE